MKPNLPTTLCACRLNRGKPLRSLSITFSKAVPLTLSREIRDVQENTKNVKYCSLLLVVSPLHAGHLLRIAGTSTQPWGSPLVIVTIVLLATLAGAATWGLIRYRRLLIKEHANGESIKKECSTEIFRYKEKDIMRKIIEMEERNTILNKIITKLERLREKQPLSYQGWMTMAIADVEKYKQNNLWEEFEHLFLSLHPNFKEQLCSKHPNLTTMEYKVCALARANIKTREISEIVEVSLKTVEAIRTRLRKKFDLFSTDVLLNDYLNTFE